MAFIGILIVNVFLMVMSVVIPILIGLYSALFVILLTVGIVLVARRKAVGAGKALLISSGAMALGALVTFLIVWRATSTDGKTTNIVTTRGDAVVAYGISRKAEDAIRDRDLDALKEILDKEPALVNSEMGNISLFEQALLTGDLAYARAFTERGRDIDPNGRSTLYSFLSATQYMGDEHAIRITLSPDALTSEQLYDAVKFLIDGGAKVNEDILDHSHLRWDLISDKRIDETEVELFRLLINSGAKCDDNIYYDYKKLLSDGKVKDDENYRALMNELEGCRVERFEND